VVVVEVAHTTMVIQLYRTGLMVDLEVVVAVLDIKPTVKAAVLQLIQVLMVIIVAVLAVQIQEVEAAAVKAAQTPVVLVDPVL
jgi:hypothetical protein